MMPLLISSNSVPCCTSFTDELLRNHSAGCSWYLFKSSGTFWPWAGLNHAIAGQCALAHAQKGDEIGDVSLHPSSESFSQEEFASLGAPAKRGHSQGVWYWVPGAGQPAGEGEVSAQWGISKWSLGTVTPVFIQCSKTIPLKRSAFFELKSQSPPSPKISLSNSGDFISVS